MYGNVRHSMLAPLALLAVGAGPATAQTAHDLNGPWIVAAWTSPDGTVQDEPQRGIFLFAATSDTGGAYSIMYVSSDEARPRYEGESLTDAEKLAAYDSFVANSGRFNVEGDRLVYEAYMAKDPNYMAEWQENGVTTTWQMVGENLKLTWVDGFTPGMSVTLRRPRGEN